ncbi:MAG: glycoside hydrolase family 78 protein [Verrucomicrobiales bacterium]|jgi:alpha-L-rhamnosidase|nr:glycoside hydrolase family 78 protein [Verrucomicrobiales bacterium]
MNPLPAAFASARWIASPIHTDVKTAPPAPFFRREFAADGDIASAQLHVTALGLYECAINGRRVGSDIFAPGWTEYHRRVCYQTHEVGELLRRGPNVIGIILGDGWYCGKLAWRDRQNYGGDRPLLLAALTLNFTDGTTLTVATGADWLTASGPIVRHGLLEGEIYDARLELAGWSSPAAGADADPRWQPVIVSAPPHDLSVEISRGVPVREHERLRPVSVTTLTVDGAVSRLFDLGQNFTGYATVSVKAARGRTLTLRFSEILADGKPYYNNLRSAAATDVYVCNSDATETWQPRFTFHGFRYVEASGLRADDELAVTGIVAHSATPPTGEFACSNRLLNQLQHNIVWGQKSNFLDVPTDCPQRDERLGWTGDAQVFIRTAAFNMDVQKFFHQWLRTMRDTQGPRGGLPPTVPNALYPLTEEEDGLAGWSDAMIICPWTLWLCYGDRQALADHYDAMRRFMEFQRQYHVKDGIRSHPDLDAWGGYGDWLAQDGNNGGSTQKDLISTAYYAYVAELMAKIAALLGHADDARQYKELHTNTVGAFRRRFVTPDGLIVSGTQTAYALALRFGLLPAPSRSAAAAELARNIQAHDWHLTTGFLGTPYLLDALTASGHLDVAYKLLEQETFPSWLFPVKHGATTIWERWDGWHPEKGFQHAGMNSFNHYAYGAVGEWMYRVVAGLNLDEARPGYQHIIFRPRPGGTIHWARASLQTADGEIAIRWAARLGVMRATLTVPKNRTATFYPPAGYDQAEPVHLTAGRHELTLQKS